MKKIVVFSAPKPCLDPHIRTIQRNAIRSWTMVGDQIDVLLIGEEPGLRDAVADLQVTIIPGVERNEMGTPLISSIFNLARQHSPHQILWYVNADIILFPESPQIINSVDGLRDDYLLVGKRWDLNIHSEMRFDPGWANRLYETMRSEGNLRQVTAIDYFIFPRHLYQNVPDFAVGRAGWDNWMIYHAMQQSWQVIDMTQTLHVVHQNHDYGHLPEGKPHYDLEESYQNVVLGGGMPTLYDLLDVKYRFQKGQIRRIGLTIPRLLRKLERFVIPDEQDGWRWSMTRILRKTRRRIMQPDKFK